MTLRDVAYFGNGDFTGLVADGFNHKKKKDKSASSTDVRGVQMPRLRLQEHGDKTAKLFHTMCDLAGLKREGTEEGAR